MMCAKDYDQLKSTQRERKGSSGAFLHRLWNKDVTFRCLYKLVQLKRVTGFLVSRVLNCIFSDLEPMFKRVALNGNTTVAFCFRHPVLKCRLLWKTQFP